MTDLELCALAEMVADVLVERGIVGGSTTPSGRVLYAAAVARLLRRERQWVYDHANDSAPLRGRSRARRIDRAVGGGARPRSRSRGCLTRASSPSASGSRAAG